MSPLWKGIKIYVLNWQNFDRCICSLSDSLSCFNHDTIVGVARGGLIPAVALSHSIGIRQLSVIDIIRNKSDEYCPERENAVVRTPVNQTDIFDKRILLVDDIVGDGNTRLVAYNEIRKENPRAITTVSIILNQGSQYKPDIYIFTVDDWVVFPWEKPPIVQNKMIEHLVLP